ncbi:MAG TPA: enoyl-CoA hydratase/isomerase family protein [Vicinamibacterales bacterium]|nr:enoyl-CoA hydratase/isomerase family protein [Vicinamibacterales bacterium]
MIEVARRNAIRIATLAHGKANAFDTELSRAISRTMAEFETSPDAALVITGTGSIFSAGVDLVRVVEQGDAYVRQFLPALGAALRDVFVCPKPVVAAVNGHAIAGGCILAAAADQRVMARGSGRIGIPELRVGVPFPTVPLEIMRFSAARHLATLAYGGGTFAPEDALARDMVDGLADANALIDAAVAMAEQLASVPAAAFALTKRAVRAPAVQRMRDGDAFDREVVDTWAAPATIAHIREYIARTFKKTPA